MYNDGNNTDPYSSWSPYDGSFGGQQQPPMVKYMSTSRLDHAGISPPSFPERPYSAHGFDTYQRQANRSTFLTSQPYLPTDPWPRKMIRFLKNVFDFFIFKGNAFLFVIQVFMDVVFEWLKKRIMIHLLWLKYVQTVQLNEGIEQSLSSNKLSLNENFFLI
jgi:hypothetical protein